MGTTAHNPLEGRRWWWPIAGVALLVLAYYLTIPIVGPYFLKVCHRATQGAPENVLIGTFSPLLSSLRLTGLTIIMESSAP